MILITDVKYDEDNHTAKAVGVLFENWTDERHVRSHYVILDGFGPYVPGEFYKRELPCLLSLLEEIPEPLEAIIVDGYVDLEQDHPGLGRHLYNAISQKTMVIGIAKSRYASANAIQILRGDSKNPLHVTSTQDVEVISQKVKSMAGPYRLPYMVKLVDQLTREI